MRYHGLVVLTFVAVATASQGQDAPVPRLLATPDSPSRLSDPRPSPRSGVPSRAIAPSTNESILEGELEALRSELQSFHAASEEIGRSAREIDAKSDRVASQQRQELLDMLTKLATQGIIRKSVQEVEPPPPPRMNPVLRDAREEDKALTITDSTIDAFALGKVLFKSGDFEKAEQAFRRVALTDDNRDLVKYLIATCQYRQKRIPEAMEGYRALIASKKDPVIRDLAKFQLDGILWLQQVEQELEQLRREREKSGRVLPKLEGSK